MSMKAKDSKRAVARLEEVKKSIKTHAGKLQALQDRSEKNPAARRSRKKLKRAQRKVRKVVNFGKGKASAEAPAAPAPAAG
ncbi:MAG: hypothetical protein AB1405_15325 [Bdellovibrionota bacterium]